MSRFGIAALACAGAVALVGCGGQPQTYTPSAPAGQVANVDFKPNAAAGVEVTEVPSSMYKTVASNKNFGHRPDPFALHPNERAYDVKQMTERIFTESSGFTVSFTPRVETVVVPVVEPQPYRRLAGVVVGDSVLALIDMGDGGPLELIRPGQVIKGWTVASIDEDKAVLRRSGNVLPKEIIVRLESPPVGGGNGGNGGGGGNRPGGNAPGGGPGQRPGANGPGGGPGGAQGAAG